MGCRAAGFWLVILWRKMFFGLIPCYQKCFAKACSRIYNLCALETGEGH